MGAKADIFRFFFKRGSCQRLIEWIEVVTSLGADKIFFYEANIHEGIKKVIYLKPTRKAYCSVFL